MNRLVQLPDRGRLIVATDLQGNLADFLQVAALFEQACAEQNDVYLVITGDLVHGPEFPEVNWPAYLGTYYRADSRAVLDKAEALSHRWPGHVNYLLGNHEHAHLGGPTVSKFFNNEARRLEQLLGPKRSAELKSWMMGWPLVAVAPAAGLVMLHAAPNVMLDSPTQLENVSLDLTDDGTVPPLLAGLLWSRTASTERAQAFLQVFGSNMKVAIYGHDVAREGYAVDREPLLCLSTSFGCHDGDKLYLDWDLSEPADSAEQVAARGLKPLYPDARPIHRSVG